MINMSNHSAELPHLTKTKFFSILAVAAIGLTAPFLRGDSGEDQREERGLAGTWLKDNEPGVNTPLLTTYMSDGSLISSRCVIVPTGPTTVELISAGHGQWIRTGHREFASTRIFLRSGPTVEFTGLVKLTETVTLNDASDQITSTGTLSIYDADNNLLFPPGTGPSTVARRVTVGQ
jgi:hypothetical protein